MAEVTVKQLAQVVGTPVDKLLVQLQEAGIPKVGEEDLITDSEKLTLLTHLRGARGQATSGGASKKITLKRKRVSELKTDASGRKKVNVEVRARRTYVRPGDAEPEAEAEEAVEEVASETAVEAPAESAPVTESSLAEADVAAEAPDQNQDAAPVDEVVEAEAAPAGNDAKSDAAAAAAAAEAAVAAEVCLLYTSPSPRDS